MKKYLALILVMITVSAAAADREHEAQSGIRLSEGVSELLRQEMTEITKGMEALVIAVASGKWAEIEETGDKIQHSYILARKLSESQKHELHQALPAGFMVIDEKFHQHAGMLADAAKARDIELVNFYIYRMQEACAECHSRFVQEKFPGFTAPGNHQHRH